MSYGNKFTFPGCLLGIGHGEDPGPPRSPGECPRPPAQSPRSSPPPCWSRPRWSSARPRRPSPACAAACLGWGICTQASAAAAAENQSQTQEHHRKPAEK